MMLLQFLLGWHRTFSASFPDQSTHPLAMVPTHPVPLQVELPRPLGVPATSISGNALAILLACLSFAHLQSTLWHFFNSAKAEQAELRIRPYGYNPVHPS